MKKFALLFLTTVGYFTYAQFTSPGNGTIYTLSSLSEAAPSVLIKNASEYHMTQDITIQFGDTLLMDENATIKVDADKAIYIYGVYSTTTSNLLITATNTEAPFKGIRFETGSVAEMKNTKIEYGGGVRVLTDSFLMDNCILYKNIGGVSSSGALSFFSGNPVVRNSQFLENSKAGIATGVSSGSSITIENNYLYGNNTDNANSPQINIGMAISDSVKVLNNTVIGNRSLTRVGGIGVSMLTGGPTKFRIEGNTVKDNRYGFTTIGANATGIVKNNIFENNDTETNPNNGGSGISVYSAQNVIIRNNQIRGNLWGITVISNGTVNLGTETDPGNNIFKNNGNNGNIVALYNNTTLPISAQGNCWREDELSTDAMVEEVIGSQTQGTITYKPYLCAAPLAVADTTLLKSKIYPNPSNGNFELDTEKSGNYIITDLSGRLVSSGIANKGKNSISTKLAPGTYILVYQSEGQRVSEKLIIK